MRSSVAVTLVALITGVVAVPLVPRDAGTCTGPHTRTTGGECRDIAGGAVGFMIDGNCISIKLAGSSAYQNKSGDCYKRIAGGNPNASGSGTQQRPSGSGQSGTQHRPSGSGHSRTQHVRTREYEEVEAREYDEIEARDGGVCTGPHTTLTGGECRDIPGGAVGFLIDGNCISIKLAGSSAYQNKSGQCYKRISGGNPVASGSGTQQRPAGGASGHSRTPQRVRTREYDEIEARNDGVCTGPHTTLSGGECRDIPGGAVGFLIDGNCISIKLAGSSAYQNKRGECYKRITGGNPVASGSGTQQRPAGGASGHSRTPQRVRTREYDEVEVREYDEIEARDGGVCTGPHTTLTGGECRDIPGGAVGFLIDGNCISIKLAGSSAYQNKSGQCYKRISGGNPVASGSGTQQRPAGGASGHSRTPQRVRTRSVDY